MKIILSPAKSMRIDTDTIAPLGEPKLISETEKLLSWLKSKTFDELKSLWNCNESIARQNYERICNMDLYNKLTPAILSYKGIAFQHMVPAVFEDGHFEYVQEHLRILSAFYGVLRPMDGVTPYRLEMQAKGYVNGAKNLYEFWGRKIYEEVRCESDIIINLASKEYSKCVEKHLTPSDKLINIIFCEMSNGKLATKGTYAKMARGEMVRYMAENNINNIADVKNFDRLGYVFRENISSEKELVFERTQA